MSDAEILAKADNIRYRALYQDYSNIVNALADSKLEVNDRLTAFNRLSEMYFANKPKTVKLPATLLKADGKPFSTKEMGEFMTRLTKKSAPDTAAKSYDPSAMRCLVDYYHQIWRGSPLSQIYPGWVIVVHPGSVAACNPSHYYIYAPVSAMPANN
jgi:hypothetical protein